MMTKNALCLSKNGLKIQACMAGEADWTIEVTAEPHPVGPDCGLVSTSRHSEYRRMPQDLPIQGAPTRLVLRTCHWRCRRPGCKRLVFAERLLELATRSAWRSSDRSRLVGLFGHQVDGRPSVRLLERLGISVSGTTVLRQVRRDTSAAYSGHTPGSVFVRHRGMVKGKPRLRDHLPGSAWSVCRGSREGTPQARQAADRFHLLQNLRELLEKEFSQKRGLTQRDRTPMTVLEQRPSPPVPSRNRSALKTQFALVRQLHHGRVSVTDIVRQTGLSLRRVDKWVRIETLRERNRMRLGPGSPGFCYRHLSERWTEGVTGIRQWPGEIQNTGFTGSRSRLADYRSAWRSDKGHACRKPAAVMSEMLPIDPLSGRRIPL